MDWIKRLFHQLWAAFFVIALCVGFPRRVMLYGLIIMVRATLCLSAARGLWMFYALGVALALGRLLLAQVPQMVILSRWFVQRRATAIGLTLAASSAGGLALQFFRTVELETDRPWDAGVHHGSRLYPAEEPPGGRGPVA